MVEMNPQADSLAQASGIIAVEGPDGHQQWALLVDAQIRYDNDVTVSYGSSPQFTVIATLPPGEKLRQASTIEAGEENVLIYSRLLVEVLREERERYAQLEREQVRLERELASTRRERVEAIERRDDALEDRDEMLYAAWTHGAKNGYVTASTGLPIKVALGRNPHPEPKDDDETETDGCHICGGPDH